MTDAADTLAPPAPVAPDLEAQGLVKAYHGRTVVEDVSIRVRCGEIVGLLGPNGAGKTTTFYMIVGLVRPNGGRILFRGQNITRLAVFRRARMGLGYLAQEASVFRKLTVEENILAILETLGLSPAQRRDRLAELLEQLSLTKVARQRAYTLSGGERRKLEIARALVRRPAILMLDEPFSGVTRWRSTTSRTLSRGCATAAWGSSSPTTTCARRSRSSTGPTWSSRGGCCAREPATS